MKKLINTEAELKKCVASKKRVYLLTAERKSRDKFEKQSTEI